MFIIFTSLAKHDDGISLGDALDDTLGESDAARDHIERLVRLQGARALEAPEAADDSFVAIGETERHLSTIARVEGLRSAKNAR